MKRNKRKILCLLIIISVSNIIPFKIFFQMAERDAGRYSYSTVDDPNSILFENGMGPYNFWYFTAIKDSSYLKQNPLFKKYYKKLYRNFRINPLYFWDWWDYVFDERYKLPFISYGDVVKNWERENGMKYEKVK